MWAKHGEAITTAICAAFVLAGGAAPHAGLAAWLADGLSLVGYVAGGDRQAIEGVTKLVGERELDVDLLMGVAAIGAASIGYWFDGTDPAPRLAHAITGAVMPNMTAAPSPATGARYRARP